MKCCTFLSCYATRRRARASRDKSSVFCAAPDREPLIVERVASFELMMVVVSAGFALGLAGGPHIAASREPGVVARPLAGRSPMLLTYLLRREARFRKCCPDSSSGCKPSIWSKA